MKTLFIILAWIAAAAATVPPTEQVGYFEEDYYMRMDPLTGMVKSKSDIAFFDAKSYALAITTYEPTNVFYLFPEHAID